jgi:hypothetical protein
MQASGHCRRSGKSKQYPAHVGLPGRNPKEIEANDLLEGHRQLERAVSHRITACLLIKPAPWGW